LTIENWLFLPAPIRIGREPRMNANERE